MNLYVFTSIDFEIVPWSDSKSIKIIFSNEITQEETNNIQYLLKIREYYIEFKDPVSLNNIQRIQIAGEKGKIISNIFKIYKTIADNQSINTTITTTTTTTTPILPSNVNSKNEVEKVKEVGITNSNYNYSGELLNNYKQINPYKKQKISDGGCGGGCDGDGCDDFGYPMEHPEYNGKEATTTLSFNMYENEKVTYDLINTFIQEFKFKISNLFGTLSITKPPISHTHSFTNPVEKLFITFRLESSIILVFNKKPIQPEHNFSLFQEKK
ncbi:hypothetical protein ACTFIR_004048 [Dictyostelium discoideum]